MMWQGYRSPRGPVDTTTNPNGLLLDPEPCQDETNRDIAADLTGG
jgi:hypothetical protein